MSDQTLVYRIRDWDQNFETRGSRKHLRPLMRISLSTSLEGLVLRRLLTHPQGAAAYGVWVLLLQIAAKTPCRGVLADPTGAYTALDLALLTGLPSDQVQAALDVLSHPRIGLLEQLPLALALLPIVESDLPPAPLIDTSAAVANSATGADAASPSRLHRMDDPGTKPPPIASPSPLPTVTMPGSTRRLPDWLPRESFKMPEYGDFQKLVNPTSPPTPPLQPV